MLGKIAFLSAALGFIISGFVFGGSCGENNTDETCSTPSVNEEKVVSETGELSATTEDKKASETEGATVATDSKATEVAVSTDSLLDKSAKPEEIKVNLEDEDEDEE